MFHTVSESEMAAKLVSYRDPDSDLVDCPVVTPYSL